MIQVGNTQYDENHFVKKQHHKDFDHFVECTYGSLNPENFGGGMKC
jgi:hypothetical protein